MDAVRTHPLAGLSDGKGMEVVLNRLFALPFAPFALTLRT